MLPVDETVDTVDLDLHPNEASDLAVVPDGGLARFDQTFVTVLDEGVIEESIAVLGHRGYPVTASGHPLLVELRSLEAYFADPDSHNVHLRFLMAD